MRFSTLAFFTLLTATMLASGCASDLTTGSIAPIKASEIYGTIPVPTVDADDQAVVEKPFVIGAVYGAGVDGPLGDILDEQTRALYWHAQNLALANGTSEEWNNESRGDHGRFTAGEEYKKDESFCRTFTSEVWITGKGTSLKGVACQNTNGSWSPV